MKITTIDRQAAAQLRAAVMPALNAALEPFGLVASIDGSVSYDPGKSMVAKLEFIAVGAGSHVDAVQALRRVQYEKDAKMLGLPVDSFGKTVSIAGNEYRIDGFASRRSTKVSLVELRTGSRKQCPADMLRIALERQVEKLAAAPR